jgi:DNA-binding beta-propeller fold protein YncE
MANFFTTIFKRRPAAVSWRLRLLLLILFLSAPFPARAGDDTAPTLIIRHSYLYHLSSFAGTVPLESATFAIDEARQEVYVLTAGDDAVRIFNAAGMQVYRFAIGNQFGQISDLALVGDGDILLLGSRRRDDPARLLRCDYRGEVQGEIFFTGLPPELGGFQPSRLVLRQGRLYLADLGGMLVAVFDLQGGYLEHFDLGEILGKGGAGGQFEGEMGGFDVDRDGGLLFTVPTDFHGYRLRPGQELEYFGEPGGLPGRFNVVTGIAAGPDGLIFVTDSLKSVICVFDRNLNFLAEFGSRGIHADGLIVPQNLAVSRSGRLYVTQLAKQGIKVFRFTAQ